MKYSIVLIAFVLSGCSSIQNEAFDSIHMGDPASKVQEIFGRPHHFRSSQTLADAQTWSYVRRSEICEFTIKEETVRDMECGRNPNYVNPVGAMLKGMGDGLKSGSTTTCTSLVNGSLIQTTCH